VRDASGKKNASLGTTNGTVLIKGNLDPANPCRRQWECEDGAGEEGGESFTQDGPAGPISSWAFQTARDSRRGAEVL